MHTKYNKCISFADAVKGTVKKELYLLEKMLVTKHDKWEIKVSDRQADI